MGIIPFFGIDNQKIWSKEPVRQRNIGRAGFKIHPINICHLWDGTHDVIYSQ